MITKREAAIISAYTGHLIGEWGDMKKYVKEITGKGHWENEYWDPDFLKEIRDKAEPDFMALEVQG